MKRGLRPERAYPPRGMRLDAAAEYVGLGRTKFLELVADGRMPAGKLVDGCRVWDRHRLDDAFEALTDETESAGGWGAVA